ncbi:MAG: hypothetical protein U9R47_05400, partial [Actinomycetota bacterium]|nr:hypothetical protein [Actinomycetota bacterium]
ASDEVTGARHEGFVIIPGNPVTPPCTGRSPPATTLTSMTGEGITLVVLRHTYFVLLLHTATPR